VARNLVTAYAAEHDVAGFSDGLTMRCEGLDLEDNVIIDAADVAIVLFATPGVTQHSRIAGNTILSAGNSTNAAISADPSTGNPGGSSLDYTGTVFENNLFWTGPNTAFDFGIEAGGRPFFATADTNSDGAGATYINNTTGQLSARVRAGIVVAGMLNVTIENDAAHPLDFLPVALPPGSTAALCPAGQVIAEVSAGHASGTFPTPSVDSDFDGCVNDPPFATVPPTMIARAASPLIFDPATETFDGTVTIENISGSTVVGPFSILFVNLTSGAVLVNATAIADGGIYFLAYPKVLSLLPGQATTIGVRFTAASSAPITFAPVILVGGVG
jgi:hypothetical protein